MGGSTSLPEDKFDADDDDDVVKETKDEGPNFAYVTTDGFINSLPLIYFDFGIGCCDIGGFDGCCFCCTECGECSGCDDCLTGCCECMNESLLHCCVGCCEAVCSA